MKNVLELKILYSEKFQLANTEYANTRKSLIQT